MLTASFTVISEKLWGSRGTTRDEKQRKYNAVHSLTREAKMIPRELHNNGRSGDGDTGITDIKAIF